MVLFAYVRRIRDEKMRQAADAMRSGAATASDQISAKTRSMKLKEKADAVTSKTSILAESVSDRAKNMVPITTK